MRPLPQGDDHLSDVEWFARNPLRSYRVRRWRPADEPDPDVRAERVDERGWFMLVFAGGKRTGIRVRRNPREFCGFEAEVMGGASDVEALARQMLAADPSLRWAA